MKKNSDLVQIIVEIEDEVKRLLKENAQLKAQITELSQPQEPSPENSDKVTLLEGEVQKFRKVVDELQKQEMTNRDRIFQLRKLIQEGPGKTSPDNSSRSKLEEAISYDPYIGVDEEEIITRQPTIGEVDPADNENFSPLPSDREAPSTDLPQQSPEVSTKSMKSEDPPLSSSSPNTDKSEKPKIPVEENPNSFLINNFDEDDDPFGDEGSKMEDDDFFKGGS